MTLNMAAMGGAQLEAVGTKLGAFEIPRSFESWGGASAMPPIDASKHETQIYWILPYPASMEWHFNL